MFSPQDWSVVVIGRWNRAILTPAGVGQNLFKTASALDVLLPVDVIAPPIVRHNGISVIAGDDRLIIQPEVCSYENLDRARAIAKNAIEFLPKTPITAVGCNIKFGTASPPGALVEICSSILDTALVEAGYNYADRSYSWTVPLQNYRINLSIHIDSSCACTAQFNFHLQSDDVEKQLAWLRLPIDDFKRHVSVVFGDCMHLDGTEIPDGG